MFVFSQVRRYAAICLANMANHPTTQVQVVVHGGLPPLLDLATSADVDSQRHALMALTNVIANESNHGAVVKAGTLPTLMALVQSPDAVKVAASSRGGGLIP